MGFAQRKPKLKTLGEGAFATVCLTSQKSGEVVEDVAIKRLKRQSSVEDSELFAKEVDVLQKISHKNIVAFKSAGKQGDTDYLVQEYIAGGTVKQLILKQMQTAQGRIYTNNDCLRWSIDIARALVYLHSGAAGSLILHRDINPDNIMLTSSIPGKSDAKLVDFGLHKSIPGSILTTQDCTLHGELPSLDNPGNFAGDDAPMEELYTLTNTTGSLMYMAPEVLLGTRYNEKADIFALGMIMYELFTNNMRLLQVCVQRNKQRSVLKYAHRVAKGMRPPIPESMPKALAEVIQACWHQDSKRRPSATALLAALERLQTSPDFADQHGDQQHQCGCFGLFSRKQTS